MVQKDYQEHLALKTISASLGGTVCSDPSCKEHQFCNSSPIICSGEDPGNYKIHYLNISSMDVDQCQCGGSAPAEIHQQFLSFTHFDQEVVPLAPVHKVLSTLCTLSRPHL
ncbi:hypothetical protein GOODEAATRI_016165 [Goodea atripinnis]|uniref:Uncharacterized protein n=1 Tax=Goodea atripinnis TaxID=208336 RepID=A0ABV0PYE9_9TELE